MLAAAFFLLAFVMHLASFLEPLSSLAARQVHVDTVIILSGVVLLLSIINWFAGVFLTDLQENQSKNESGAGDWLTGIVNLVRLVLRTPLWMNLTALVFIGYLVATFLLIPAGSYEQLARLKTFGAVCSALNLHAFLLLSAQPPVEM